MNLMAVRMSCHAHRWYDLEDEEWRRIEGMTKYVLDNRSMTDVQEIEKEEKRLKMRRRKLAQNIECNVINDDPTTEAAPAVKAQPMLKAQPKTKGPVTPRAPIAPGPQPGPAVLPAAKAAVALRSPPKAPLTTRSPTAKASGTTVAKVSVPAAKEMRRTTKSPPPAKATSLADEPFAKCDEDASRCKGHDADTDGDFQTSV